MNAPRTYKGIQKRIKEMSPDISEYFDGVSDLIDTYIYEVSLAYMFYLVEKAQNRAIYCGIVRLYDVHKDIAKAAVEREHMTRASFRAKYKSVFGSELPRELVDLISDAEKIRDKVMHGKDTTEEEKRKAIVDVIDYAEKFNDLTDQIAGFRPFGDLRGFKGARASLPKPISRLVVKGLGFNSFS